MTRIWVLLLALATSAWHSGQAQNWDRYRPGRLAPIMAAHQSSFAASVPDSVPQLAVSGQDFATAARLIYTGQRRPMAPERVRVLREWQRTLGISPSVLEAFENEYLFREDTLQVWLPVQKTLETSLTSEARPGQEITVLVIFLGGHALRHSVTWLFLVNEFDAGPG